MFTRLELTVFRLETTTEKPSIYYLVSKKKRKKEFPDEVFRIE